MLIPYTGKALETYSKIHNMNIYEQNTYYKFKDHIYYYVNSKGYLHVVMIDTIKINGKKNLYISNQMLTKDNILKETSYDPHYYDDIEAAKDRYQFIISNNIAV